MFEVLWINQAIVNGSGSRACGFFSSEACFSEIDTGSLKFSPTLGKEQSLNESKYIPTFSVDISTPTPAAVAHSKVKLNRSSAVNRRDVFERMSHQVIHLMHRI